MATLQEKVKLSGFNNLTKILSFNLYDFAIATTEEQRQSYIAYIDERYSAARLRDIAREICRIIEANILAESIQDYDPVGASTMTLMSDVKGGGGAGVQLHLDKSHITTHTYPDASDPEGICTFRVDLDVATCGEIVPLRALDFMFRSFECDVVYIDYVVRGYTRLESGKKIYNDHPLDSIQDFIARDILERYVHRQDVNMPADNTWQTKLMTRAVDPRDYVLDPRDAEHPRIGDKMRLLDTEMREVFHLT
ncbi:MAG: adenosylmethionine decarboxylase [Deltaproteobacteria bacterium]|nr:adenosylmethionine decarboxylase [Deltaproteobacteria bacterium]